MRACAAVCFPRCSPFAGRRFENTQKQLCAEVPPQWISSPASQARVHLSDTHVAKKDIEATVMRFDAPKLQK